MNRIARFIVALVAIGVGVFAFLSGLAGELLTPMICLPIVIVLAELANREKRSMPGSISTSRAIQHG